MNKLCLNVQSFPFLFIAIQRNYQSSPKSRIHSWSPWTYLQSQLGLRFRRCWPSQSWSNYQPQSFSATWLLKWEITAKISLSPQMNPLWGKCASVHCYLSNQSVSFFLSHLERPDPFRRHHHLHHHHHHHHHHSQLLFFKAQFCTH